MDWTGPSILDCRYDDTPPFYSDDEDLLVDAARKVIDWKKEMVQKDLFSAFVFSPDCACWILLHVSTDSSKS